jgi:CRP/FNR family transcriptional regulator, cyclic AMP receptor protein
MSESQVLRANPWFATLPPALADAVLAAGRAQKLAAGEVLFRQGDAPGDWHAVCSGAIKASSTSADGTESILAVLEPGNWFGEISLLDAGPRVHDATAVGATAVFAVPAEAFARFMQDPVFATALARLMAGRLRMLFGMLEDATLRPTRARLARRLALLARGDATLASEPRQRLPVSQEALAMMLGLTRQTLSKELGELARAGALKLGYRSIDIVDAGLLDRLGD